MDLRNLPTLNTLSNTITICEHNGIKIIRIIHDTAEAGISLHGGHLIWFKPQNQEDVIWLSEDAIFDSTKAIRGGIPICWPWFGRIAAPAHGFARTSNWTLAEHRENDHGVMVSLNLTDSEETLAIWPHKFSAKLNFEIGAELKITLDVTNTDSSAWTCSGALHTYLNIAEITDSVITGMGTEYIDGLNDGQITAGGKELKISDAVDRVYTQPETDQVITDPKHNRSLVVTNQGHNAAVIWNPWQDGAKGMADMNDNGYKTMLCVESTIHAPNTSKGITLQPGEHHELVSVISIK
ncbi:D-hexose-6-phosphate mutarotase [Vibrio sp. Of7-15]|uniref:D-hexose-6-phosphate mutarotase n=1 Tax=Vibrio sp. Of7-15 TaxID=2724879 RepID=UPI001EF20A15|nr:D-hexose-6-phosphate mutarotase [Vibrio sp. Of7-15]MCG7495857.1 D-hexose-6-phosphate mutarotase [Vibrio sp. Of7-15]